MQYGDFICTPCTLYVDLVEKFKFLVRICLAEQVTCTNNRKAVSCYIS
jgi:hypothetical protein